MAREELIDYPIAVTGAEQAARSVVGVSDAFVKSQRSADLWERSIAGAERRSSAMRLATDRLAISATTAARATELAAATSSTWATNASRLAPSLSAVGSTLSRLTPELGAYASSMGRAGTAMVGVTSVIGGVGGLVAGGLIGGLGALIDYSRDATKAQNDHADAAKKAAKELDAYARAAEGAAFFAGVRQRGPNLTGTAEELRDQRLSIQAQLDSSARVGGAKLSAGERQSLIERRAQLDEAAAAASLLKPGVALSDVPGVDGSSGGGGGGKKDTGGGKKDTGAAKETFAKAQQRRLDTVQSEMEKSRRRDAELAGFQAQLNAGPDAETLARRDQEKADIDALARKKDLIAEESAAKKKMFEKEVQDRKDTAREVDKIDAETASNVADRRAMAGTAIKAFGGLAISTAQKAAKGEKISGDQAVAAIGGTLVALGVMMGHKGVDRGLGSYGFDPTAWGYIAAGSAAVIAGIGMGGAGSGGSPSGGAGAGGRPRATPIAASRETGSDRPETTHVHFHSTVPSTDAQAEVIVRAIQRGKRTGRVASSWNA